MLLMQTDQITHEKAMRSIELLGPRWPPGSRTGRDGAASPPAANPFLESHYL